MSLSTYPNWNNTVIHASLSMNSTTMYTYDNTTFTSKLANKLNYTELVAKELSNINAIQMSGFDQIKLANKVLVPDIKETGSINPQTEGKYVNFVLYFKRQLMENNDLITIVIIGSEQLMKSFVQRLLDVLMEEYLDCYYVSSTSTNSSNAYMNCEYKNRMKSIITDQERIINEATRNYSSINDDIDEVRMIMNDNIDQVLNRGQTLETLINKTNNLNSTSSAFKRRTVSIKRKFWWSNVKFVALLGGIVFLFVYVLIGLECGLPFYSNCVHPKKPVQPPPSGGHKSE